MNYVTFDSVIFSGWGVIGIGIFLNFASWFFRMRKLALIGGFFYLVSIFVSFYLLTFVDGSGGVGLPISIMICVLIILYLLIIVPAGLIVIIPSNKTKSIGEIHP